MIKLTYSSITILFLASTINIFYEMLNKNKKDSIIKINNFNTKLSNMSFIKKIQFYIDYISKINKSIIFYIKPITIILLSSIISIITFVISFKYLKVFSSAVIISVYSFFIPYLILKYLYNFYRKKINNIFPTYIISLKNYTQISNDIIIAIKKVKVEEPLSLFINKFNICIEKGINVYEAFENLKNDINIKKINEFITATQNCYINGGNFTNLLSKYSKILNRINEQREKELQENLSSILVLVILIIINIFLIVTFVYSDENYRSILTNTFLGKSILNINILSYLLIFYFIKKLNKLEE